MRWRRAEPPASRTRAAVPPPVPRPLAIGRRSDAHAGLARCRGPAGPGSCREGRTGRRLHKGWRGGDGGREGDKEVPGPTGSPPEVTAHAQAALTLEGPCAPGYSSTLGDGPGAKPAPLGPRGTHRPHTLRI
ncbi:hypothetical protein R6Z07F_011231 [Ovis aries]